MSPTISHPSRGTAAARSLKSNPLPDPAQIISARDLLVRAESRLRESDVVTDPTEEFSALYQSALRAAGAVLAVTERPTRRRGSRSAWSRLPQAVPEMTGWATYFAGLSRLRADAEVGLRAVSEEQIASLRPRVDEFLHAVETEIVRREQGKSSKMPAGAA
ncbi:SAV_6107 family HEPN domain-containing protein [Williamsia soli]|uniref:SAV_6107 family HEPN domain-containing protein n=1 Tax=Williamsia soli TaxID=364929 RepID=UPI001A9FD044|nr:SAV_6107 family HEPN domain-containing protein [Williamsia soli]